MAWRVQKVHGPVAIEVSGWERADLQVVAFYLDAFAVFEVGGEEVGIGIFWIGWEGAGLFSVAEVG